MRESGIKSALASSSKNAKTVIQLLHIQNDFDVVVDGTMITHTKPHPEIFLLAAEKLGVEPENCVWSSRMPKQVLKRRCSRDEMCWSWFAAQLKDANRIVSKTANFDLPELQN